MPKQLKKGTIVYLPAGEHEITCTLGGKPTRTRVTVTPECVPLLQRDLDVMQAAALEGSAPRPCGLFDHKAGAASFLPKRFRWEEGRGVMLDLEWTEAGRQAIEGGNYCYHSPLVLMEPEGTRPIGLVTSGVEVGSLVNDPAFRSIEAIAASRVTLEAAHCNQHGHAPGCRHADAVPETAKLPRPRDKENEEDTNATPGLLDDPEHDHLFEEDPYEDRLLPGEGTDPYRDPEPGEDEQKPRRVKGSADNLPPTLPVEKTQKPAHNAGMDKLKQLLGLPADADEAAILAAVEELKSGNKSDEALAAAQEETKKAQQEAEQNKQKAEESEKELKAARAELDQLKEAGVNAFLAEHEKAGRLAPRDEAAKKAWGEFYRANPLAASNAIMSIPGQGAKGTPLAGGRTDDPKGDDRSLGQLLTDTYNI